jgi:Rps23 Pro-64 3,4-dihydroxylase Tpa1-like proline 4-hydroxylase
MELLQLDRNSYAQLIAKTLTESKEKLHREFNDSSRIKSCIIDDLLPEHFLYEIYNFFPKKEELACRNDVREFKYTSSQMDRYHSIIEEAIYAFQAPEVIRLISEITGIKELISDEKLYAGGISLMDRGCYLNPHIDNSHDQDKKNYRVLNLLYYISPDWEDSDGGNLELWDRGIKQQPRLIVSKFNRLVIMATDRKSIHSVNKVRVNKSRCCISNYYFSPCSLEGDLYYHSTSFRGRPEEPISDLVLQAETKIRSSLRTVLNPLFQKGVIMNHHFYKKKKQKNELQ